jgi:putative SOS response-associated peptidase YedK
VALNLFSTDHGCSGFRARSAPERDWSGWPAFYESRQPEPGYWQGTFTIITTRANLLIEPIHDRIPVILDGRAA